MVGKSEGIEGRWAGGEAKQGVSVGEFSGQALRTASGDPLRYPATGGCDAVAVGWWFKMLLCGRVFAIGALT